MTGSRAHACAQGLSGVIVDVTTHVRMCITQVGHMGTFNIQASLCLRTHPHVHGSRTPKYQLFVAEIITLPL